MIYKNISHLILGLFFAQLSYSQVLNEATLAEERLAGFEKRKLISGDHILKNLEFKSIGPTIMGGRVTDVEVSPTNPNHFYIAYASGGLWRTENNGQSYEPLFDHEMVMSIGDIAIDWEHEIIWIGTGENNSSRSSYSGFGVYRSDDWGETWKNMGLHDSHHIGRIVLNPKNPDVVWVAAIGHLYTPNEERGVFKTVDGGKSWKKVLYVDENSGAIDLIIDQDNPQVLFASVWHRQRKAWDFTEGGSSSGIFKSEDAGETWAKKTGGSSGFPEGEGVGRIGLTISSGENKVIYAILDNQFRREAKDKKLEGLQKEDLKKMTKDEFLKVSDKDLKSWLQDNDFPKIYTTDTIKKMVKKNEIKPASLVDYIEDANRNLFETEIIGAEVYASVDGGNSWERTHEDHIDDLVYTYGYYFGQIRVSPIDPNKIYIVGVPILKSDNGGKTFESINGDNQHVDHHALWVSSTTEGHLINGNDGGINISLDDGENWLKVNSPPVGQFYTVNVDNAKPYNVYGGLQDNGVWKGPSTYKTGTRWQYLGKYPYTLLLGGDGFKVEIDSRDNTVYTGYQFGHYFRIEKGKGRLAKITPRHELGERPLRFNWQTPIWLSRHNEDVLYFGSNKFHRSLDRGSTYDVTTADLSNGAVTGNVAFGTITHIHESPLKFGLLYLGTDDGLVYRSDNLGYDWQNITTGLPSGLWVTSIQASAHDTSKIYLALNGYRNDNFNSYLFVSEDYGNSWQTIGDDLPLEPVNVLKEDPTNEKVLYVGTDNGLYISINRGKSFMAMSNGIPAVAVHDLVIQQRDHELVVGTHGRSLYKTDVKHLQKLTDSILDKGIHLFNLPSVDYNEGWGRKYNAWRKEDTTSIRMCIYVKNIGDYDLNILTEKGLTLSKNHLNFVKGLNYFAYDLTFESSALNNYQKELEKDKSDSKKIEKGENGKYYLKAGKFQVSVSNSNATSTQKFTIKEDEKK